jgi:hypothetical protein
MCRVIPSESFHLRLHPKSASRKSFRCESESLIYILSLRRDSEEATETFLIKKESAKKNHQSDATEEREGDEESMKHDLRALSIVENQYLMSQPKLASRPRLPLLPDHKSSSLIF